MCIRTCCWEAFGDFKAVFHAVNDPKRQRAGKVYDPPARHCLAILCQ